MSTVNTEVTGFTEMSRDMRAASRKLVPNVRKAVEINLRLIKDGTKKNIPRRYFGKLVPGISYDIEAEATKVQGQVVSRGRRASRLIGVLENGSPTSAPKKPMLRAITQSHEDFMRGIDRAVEDAFG